MLTTHPLSRSSVLLLLVTCLALPAWANGPSWPNFHGPNQDNKSTETGLLDKWPEGGPKLIWKADGLGYGYSGVSIAGGRVYVVSDDGRLYCLNLKTGRHLWEVDGTPTRRSLIGNDRLISTWPARGGVVVSDGVAYFAPARRVAYYAPGRRGCCLSGLFGCGNNCNNSGAPCNHQCFFVSRIWQSKVR